MEKTHHTNQLPEYHRPFTDKYFLRTRDILEKENINPQVSIKVFARGKGPVSGMQEAVSAIMTFSDLEKYNGEIWISRRDTFENKDPLLIIKGPVQEIVELETLYLGIVSHSISRALGIAPPSSIEVKKKLERLKGIYGEVPIIYFGARHYHWSLDKIIAAAALEGGAVQTSTDVGSANIGQKGVGTTPHLLTIVLASVYGKRNATLRTAQLFDKHMDPAIPRVTLVDTFNKELTDGLAVAAYFGKRKNALRVDTCGENIGEGGSLYNGKKQKDPSYMTGTGVTVELVTNLRNLLLEKGFADSTDIFLSSGFGNEEKAQAFVSEHKRFISRTGYPLFTGVGIGEVSTARFCTADIFEVDGIPLAKTGRDAGIIDYESMERVL